METEDIVGILRAMRRQESDDAYLVRDYLHDEPVDDDVEFEDDERDDDDVDDDESISNHGRRQDICIDSSARRKMIEWCYQVVDLCKYRRETVSVAVCYLDRFLSTPTGETALASASVFQLAVLTCLYTAVKMHEAESLDPATIAFISRGAFTKEQVTAMELTIIRALAWRLNPPTSTAFLHYLMKLTSHVMTPTDQEIVHDHAAFQLELATTDYEFATLKPSFVAVAALMNAVEQHQHEDKCVLQEMWLLISTVAALDCHAPLIQIAKHRLGEIMTNELPIAPTGYAGSSSTSMSLTCSAGQSKMELCDHHSPRSILRTRS